MDTPTLLWAALALAASSGPLWAQPRDNVYVAHGPWTSVFYHHAAVAAVDPVALDFLGSTPVQSGLWTATAHPGGRHVYLTSVDSTDIVAIDTSTNQVDPTRTISVGFVPARLGDARWLTRGVTFRPDGAFAAVVGDPGLGEWIIKLFDTTTGGEVGLIEFFGGSRPWSVEFSPDGALLLASEQRNEKGDFVKAFRAQPPFDLLGTLQVGRGVSLLSINPSGDKILVTSRDPGALWVISVNPTGDLLTLDRTISFPGGAIPLGATFAPSGEFAHVTGGVPQGDPPSAGPSMIFKVDPNTGDIGGTIGDGSAGVSYSCCQYSPNSALAFARFDAIEIPAPPAVFASGLIKIDTVSHTVLDGFAEQSPDPFPFTSSGLFAVTSDGHRVVYDEEIAFGPPVLRTLNLDNMQVIDERALDDDVVGMAIVTPVPGEFAQRVLNVGSVAYVADFNGISIIKKDGLTFTLDGSFPIQGGATDLTFALNDNFFRAYALRNSGVVAVPIDLESRMLLPGVPVAGNTAIRATADGTCVFVTDGRGTIFVINTTNNMVEEQINVGQAVSGIAVTDFSCNPANRGPHPRAFAGANRQLLEINLETMPPTRRAIPGLDGLGIEVAITLDGKFTYVATNGNGVYLISTDPDDPNPPSVVGRLQGTGFFSQAVAISPSGRFVYVADRSGPVSKYETGSLIREAQINLTDANGPTAIALTTDGGFAFVANSNSNSVLVIRTSDMTVAAGPIAIGPFPVAIAAR